MDSNPRRFLSGCWGFEVSRPPGSHGTQRLINGLSSEVTGLQCVCGLSQSFGIIDMGVKRRALARVSGCCASRRPGATDCFGPVKFEFSLPFAQGGCAAEGIEAKRWEKEPNQSLLLRTVALAAAGKSGTVGTFFHPSIAVETRQLRNSLESGHRPDPRNGWEAILCLFSQTPVLFGV